MEADVPPMEDADKGASDCRAERQIMDWPPIKVRSVIRDAAAEFFAKSSDEP
jgi:hypothetical protein